MKPEDYNSPPGNDGGAGEQFHDWSEGLTEGQMALQYQLSCLADGELSDSAAAQALVQIENDEECFAFFEDVKRCARLHRDVMDPERISARFAMLAGEEESGSSLQAKDRARRLASIFYQLGKAYVLSGVDFDKFREQVFDQAVPIHSTKTMGRGFVDGVLSTGDLDKEPASSGRWAEARHMLNGRLERIQDPIQKGIKLLEQALEIEDDHEEARIYLAFVHGLQGRNLRAERLYKEVFDTAVNPDNRGHAAMQIGQLYTQEGDHRRAAHYYRWVTLSGLASSEPRFWPAYFNLGIASVGMGRAGRGLLWLRELLDRYPDRAPEVASMSMQSPTLRRAVDGDAEFAARFEQACPELFSVGSQGGTVDDSLGGEKQ